MKALKAFIKPFEAPQRSLKIKVDVNYNCIARVIQYYGYSL